MKRQAALGEESPRPRGIVPAAGGGVALQLGPAEEPAELAAAAAGAAAAWPAGGSERGLPGAHYCPGEQVTAAGPGRVQSMPRSPGHRAASPAAPQGLPSPAISSGHPPGVQRHGLSECLAGPPWAQPSFPSLG